MSPGLQSETEPAYGYPNLALSPHGGAAYHAGIGLPGLTGEVRHLQPGLFSICTHLVASNEQGAGRPVSDGGLGYTGVLTTLEGMVQEVVEWNRDHQRAVVGERKVYQTSVSLADEIAKAAARVELVVTS